MPMHVTLERRSGHCALRCPRCGGGELHQRTVAVQQRVTEDGPGTTTTLMPEGTTVIVRSSPEQMLGRRDSLFIEFECELRIYQHKGVTHLEWA